jgi:hypothetical protein
MENIELCLYKKRSHPSPNGICGDLTIASNCQRLPLVLNVMNLFFLIMYAANAGCTMARP